MINSLKSKIGQFFLNNLGWKTKEKIVVFESDDWGGVSMPNKTTYHALLKKGIRVEAHPYSKFDSLASEEDLYFLLEVLSKHRNYNGRNPIFTLNTNVANPDFEKIKVNNFQQYFYEPFTITLNRYQQHGNPFQLWKEGIKTQLLEPQFHGREHLNNLLWLEQLRENRHKDIRIAFDYDFFNLPKSSYPGEKWILNSAFFPNNNLENNAILEAIDSGVDLFLKIFKCHPRSFIATGYIWNSNIEKNLAANGIHTIQGLPIQRQPDYNTQSVYKTYNYTGKYNQHNQTYLIRNSFFEPTLNPGKDVVRECLKRIEVSFRNKKPAIIGTHRVNYIGSLVPKNRDHNLKLLDQLLRNIVKKWPDVNFMSSSQLGSLILARKNSKIVNPIND